MHVCRLQAKVEQILPILINWETYTPYAWVVELKGKFSVKNCGTKALMNNTNKDRTN